nr:retrovirus-related Pol polyprotein from transposon TNT 1-94 [Tanacetum cinerariifolium]
MHNNIMAAGSRDRPPMLAIGRYPQWQSRFLRYIDTRPSGDALRKCILEGPYQPNTVTILAVHAIKSSLVEAIHLLLTGIGDEIYSTIDVCKTAHEMWIAIERIQQGKKIAKSITPPFELTFKEDSDLEQAERDKDMQKKLALIAKYFKKIYKPTNKYLRTSNSRTRMWILLQGSQVVQQTGIQCFNYKEFGHFAKEYRKPKRVKDSTYHKEKMLLCKQAEKGVPLQAEQDHWLEDTNEEIDGKELEAHYSYKAKIQEVHTTDSGNDIEPLEQVHNDAEYNVFANVRHQYEQLESTSNTCLVKKDDSNVNPNLPDMCDNDILTKMLKMSISTPCFRKYRVSDLSPCVGSELGSKLTSFAGSELGSELTSFAAPGSDTRPLMLDRTDYDLWSQRIQLYCKGKENGIYILQSIDHGPFKLGTTRDTLGTTPEGGVLLEQERPRMYDDLNDNEKKRFDADVRATNIVLQGLPKDIYKLINHNIEAKVIWDNVKMLLAGFELAKEYRESQLYDEFERFKMLSGENINEYYVRFHKLVNDIRNIRMTMPNIQLNSKFVNNMSPEWDRLRENLLEEIVQLAMGEHKLELRMSMQNFDYFKDKMLLMQTQENSAVLDEEELLFLTGEQTNNFDADVDDHPVRDLTLIDDNIFQADECDAFDLDVDDEPTARSIFMANLSSAVPTNQQADPSNASILFEDEHEIYNEVQQKNIIYSTKDHMDAYVPHDPLVTELNIYKEQLAIYEQRARFELRLREQKMDEQMSILIQDRDQKEENLKKELHSHTKLSDEDAETTIGVHNPFYLKHTQRAQPALYDGNELLKMHHVPVLVPSSEEDLELAKTTIIKMNEKMKDHGTVLASCHISTLCFRKYRVSDLSSCVGNELGSELNSFAGSELGSELTSFAGSELGQASYSNSDDIQVPGSDTRPLMLDRTDYDLWSQRIQLYCKGKENGIYILQSIDHGPFKLGTTRDTLDTTPEGGVLLGQERPRMYDDLNDNEKKRFDADVRATNIVLQGLPKDIYKLINHNIEAKAIWDNVKMLLAGFELAKEYRES